MCACYGSFRVKAKGVTYGRVQTDIGLYMCVHIIQRYGDTMREKGREGRERKETNIYIYIKSTGLAPSCLRCCFYETTRTAVICSCMLYMHLSVHAHITHTRARIRARMRMHMHMTHSRAHAQTRMHPGTCGPSTHAHTHPRMNTRACMRTHTRYARIMQGSVAAKRVHGFAAFHNL